MQKMGGIEELPSDKHRRIGSKRVERQGRARVPFGALNNKTDTNDVGSAEGSECSTIDFTKENVEALLNEKMKKGINLTIRKKCSRWQSSLSDSNFVFDGLGELKKAASKKKKTFRLISNLLRRNELILGI